MIAEFVALTCLGYGSFQDMKTREISDIPWFLMGVFGIILRASDQQWKELALSAGVALLLGVILAGSGLFGGADIKAFIALSLLIPTYKGAVLPVFIISVFNNVAVLRLGEIVVVFFYNIVSRNIIRENIPAWKKILLTATGFPRSREKLDYRFLPLQDAEGTYHLMPDINVDIEAFKEECALEDIWVTYGSPLIAYFFLACIISFLYGDILFHLIL